MFKNTIRASYSGFVVGETMLFPRMGMVFIRRTGRACLALYEEMERLHGL